MRTVNRAATRRIGDLVQALERRTLLSGAMDGLFPGMPGASVDTGLSYTHGTVIADFTRDGIPDLVGLNSTTLFVHPGLGDGRFGSHLNTVSLPLSWGISANTFDIVDVNGDGRLDVTIDYSWWSSSRFVAIMTQNEDGSFASPSQTFSNFRGLSSRLIDVDSDGDLDFIESYNWTSQLTIQTNDGTGTFTPGSTLNVPDLTWASMVDVADFDGDGLGDLLFVSHQIFLMRRHVDGTYSLGWSSWNSGSYVAVADVNADGLPDLVTPTAALGGSDVSVLTNLGGWSFAEPTARAILPGTVSGLTIGDLNQDGQVDVVASVRLSATVNAVMVLDAIGSSDPSVPLLYDAAGFEPAWMGRPMAMTDLNGDGYRDIVIHSAQSAGVLLNHRDGSFRAPVWIATGGTAPITTASADLDGDGLADVVSVDPVARSIILHRSLGLGDFEHAGTFGIQGTSATTWPNNYGTRRVSLSLDDVNGDQRPDVVVAVEGFDRATLLWSAGAGLYAQAAITLGSVVRSLQVADHDRDGRVDLLIDSASGRQSWRKGLGNGAFAAVQSLATASRSYSFFLDLNRDGVLDIVSQSPSWPNRFATQLGQFDGSFSEIVEQDVSVSFPWLGADGVFVDVDADGDPDVAGWNGLSLFVHRNRGDATFEPAYTTGGLPVSMPVGTILHFRSDDFDHDGEMDLLGVSASHVILWMGLGDGLFDTPSWEQRASSLTSAPALADFDGDTQLDLVVGSMGGPRLLRNLRDAAPPNAVTLNPADDTGVWGDDQITRAETIRFAVTHDDPTARIELRRNSQLIAVRTGSGELVDPNVPAGTHAYTALAVVGNRESRATASLTVTIDRTAPAAPPAPVLQASSDSGVSNADRITNVTTPTFDIASTDSFYRAFVNGVQVGGDYLTGPFTAPSLPEGVHIVSIRAVDAAGNVSEAGADLTITIDTTAPTVAQSTFVFEVGHVLEFLFNDLVTGAPTTGHLTVTNLTTGAVVPSSLSFLNSLATFSFPQFASGLLREGNYRATLTVPSLTDRAGNVGTASAMLDFHVLTADVNRNRIVDFADLLAVAQNYGQFGRTFSQGNVDYSGDGFVGFNDLLTLAQSYGRSLLIAPAPETASRVGVFSRSNRRIGEELAESLG